MERQQQVVASLLSTVTSAEVLTSPSRLDALADAFTASTVVDEALTGRRMLSLAGSLRDVRGGDVHSWTMTNHWTRNDPVVGSVAQVGHERAELIFQPLEPVQVRDLALLIERGDRLRPDPLASTRVHLLVGDFRRGCP